MSGCLIGLTADQFCGAFPFHFVFDDTCRIRQVGPVLARISPSIEPGVHLSDVLSIARPRVSIDFEQLQNKSTSLFILRVTTPRVTLRGQIVIDEDRRLGFFLGSPWMTRVEEATALGLSIGDFANHDAVGEFMMLFQTKDMALADAEALTERLRQQSDELRAANDQLALQEQQLRDSNLALSQAARLKDEFLSSMSHELRTPLNAILGMSESLLEDVYGAIDERQRRAVSLVESSGRHLLDLINDILDLSRIEAGRLELDIEPVDVATVCQAAMGMVRTEASRKSLTLQSEIAGTVTTVEADQRRLKQILVNLLSNAVKFTPEGGSVTLTVSGDAAQGTVRFAVADTGIGIAEENLPRLFRPFEQLDSGLARHHGGTGLGLALTRRMSELHGGSVAVESQHGSGSTFSVTLPWTASDRPLADTAVSRVEVAAAAERPDRGHVRILVVDDNESNRRVLAGFLKARHFDVATANTALSGIHMARLLRPHVILMDIQMPDMDGLEATALIRQDPALAQTSIFAVTGLAMKGDRERCLAAGVDEYFSKPVRLRDLLAHIEARLPRQAVAPATPS